MRQSLSSFLGTIQDNHADMCNKGRNAKGEKHGSKTCPEKVAKGCRNGAHTHPEKVKRGVDHFKAKLTESKVVELHRLVRDEHRTIREAAVLLNIPKGTAQDAITGKTWAHIPFPVVFNRRFQNIQKWVKTGVWKEPGTL